MAPPLRALAPGEPHLSHLLNVTAVRRAALALAATLLCPYPATAGEPAPAPAGSQYTEEAVSGLLLGSSELGVEVHGFVNLEYYAFQNDPGRSKNSFDIHNVYLLTKARVASTVTLVAELEYEHGSTAKLDQAFIEFEIAPPLTLRAGRFSAPLSYERIHYAAPVRAMTSRPASIDIAFHEWVDTGVEAFGRLGRFGYDLAILNGPRGLTEAGIPNTDVLAVGQNKAFLGRLNVYPAPFLEGGLAGAAGTYDPDGRLWFYLAELDARLHRGPLDVWAEVDYRAGDDEPCGAAQAGCNPSYAGDHANKVGYYLLVGYSLLQGAPHVHYLKPLLRFDEIEDLKAHTGQRRVTAGLNWSPAPHVVLKSELQRSFPLGQPGRESSSGFMMSAVADF